MIEKTQLAALTAIVRAIAQSLNEVDLLNTVGRSIPFDDNREAVMNAVQKILH